MRNNNNNEFWFSSEHLAFRPLQKEDICYLENLESDPELKKYFPNGPLEYPQTVALIERFLNNAENHQLFLLFDKSSHEFIGRAGFSKLETGEIEIGYLIHKKFWGKGYATEAVKTLLKWAKKNVNAAEIIAYAMHDNLASFRVMEKSDMTYYKTKTVKGFLCKFYKIKNF